MRISGNDHFAGVGKPIREVEKRIKAAKPMLELEVEEKDAKGLAGEKK